MVYVLAIDTTFKPLSIALVSDRGETLFSAAAVAENGASEALLATEFALSKIAASIGWELSELRDEISKVVVSIGPGSYTGLRTGIAWAEGLAQGLGCELVGITTLLAGAASFYQRELEHKKLVNSADEKQEVCIAQRASASDSYFARFEFARDAWRAEEQVPQLLSNHELAAQKSTQRKIILQLEDLDCAAESWAERLAKAGLSLRVNAANDLGEHWQSGSSIIPQYVKGVNALTIVERQRAREEAQNKFFN